MASMSWLLLFWLLLVWWLWVVACATQRALADAHAGTPVERRGGVSVLPIFPIFPCIAWGIAGVGDRFANPYGSVVIAALHAVFALALLLSIFRDRLALRDHERRA
jgi:hypothetical protein